MIPEENDRHCYSEPEPSPCDLNAESEPIDDADTITEQNEEE